MNIPEEVAKVLLKSPYGNNDSFSRLLINAENYGAFRAEVMPWEVHFDGSELFFMGVRVIVVRDPLNIWRLT